MLEKRNVVRRNLTGLLALGAAAGLLSALPDTLSALLSLRETGTVWLGVVLLFFFDGIVTGGFLGLARGLFRLLVERFSEDHAQAQSWNQWGRRALAAGWAGSIFPSLPMDMVDRFLFTFMLAALAAGLLPAAHDFCFQSIHRRDRIPRTVFCIGALMAAGFAATASAWGGPRWFDAPGFWFMTGFFLHTGAISLAVLAVRVHSGSRGRVFSRLASPLSVGLLLLLAMLGGSAARRLLDEAVRDGELRRVSALAYGLMEGAGAPGPGGAADAGPYADAGSRPDMSESPLQGLSWKSQSAGHPIETWRIAPGRSLLVVTAVEGENPSFSAGVCYTGGWRAGAGLEMDLGSLFTGRHLPLWAVTAPERPAPGPLWHHLAGVLDVVRYGTLEIENPEYFREIPGFGFPEPFNREGVSPVETFLRTRDLLKKPFFAWVHQSGGAQEAAISLQEAAKKDDFFVLWLTFREEGTVDACLFDSRQPRDGRRISASFTVAGILPALLPVSGHRTEFTGTGFPAARHPRVRLGKDGVQEAVPGDFRRLNARVRLALKRAGGKWPQSLSAWADFLDSRICRGEMSAAETRRLFSAAGELRMRPELSRRLDMLQWRMGLAASPPDWAVRQEWRRVLGKIGISLPVGEFAEEDPLLAAWLSVMRGDAPGRVLKHCPGYPYVSSFQGTVGKGNRREKGK